MMPVAHSGLARVLVSPLSWVYGAGVRLRNTAFNLGILPKKEAGIPVISVGNLTAGGTGKTPLVEYLVGLLLKRGRRVGVVSRGYGRAGRGVTTVSSGAGPELDARAGGDEPVQIAGMYPETIVVVGERKSAAARHARDRHGADVVVLDDGFQHRHLQRTADIVVVDARRDITTEGLLPVGLRREPLSALRRADLVVLSKVVSLSTSVPWLPALRQFYDGPLVWTTMRHAGIVRGADGSTVGPEDVAGTRVYVFSGIADHAGFVSDVLACGMVVAGDRRFPDHYPYTARDADLLEREAKECDAALLVTTEKDLVRLRADSALKARLVDPGSLVTVRIAVEVLKGEEHLTRLLDRVLESAPC